MKLSTTTVGDGPKTAALVHGLSGDSGTWFEFAPWLASLGYTVTLVDQRGHGASPRADSYLAEDLADDLVDTLPVGMDVIMGHSLGGRALILAAERLRPQRAVYLDPGWNVPPELEFALPVDESGEIASIEALADLIPEYSAEHVANARRSLQLYDPAWVTAPNPVLPDQEPHVPPVVPSLVVLADPPKALRPEVVERLRAGGYEVVTVPGGHHDLHIVNLEATKQALAGWV